MASTLQTPLGQLLSQLGVSQGTLSRTLGRSGSVISNVVKSDQWPVKTAAPLRLQMRHALIELGATRKQVAQVLPLNNISISADPSKQVVAKKTPPGAANAKGNPSIHPSTQQDQLAKDDTIMTLRKQTLTQAARQHFNLLRDPFSHDVREVADIFLTPSLRYIRETLWTTVKHGGMLALIGESGSGKTTLRLDLIDRVSREKASVHIIQPYTQTMSTKAIGGQIFSSSQIADSILQKIMGGSAPLRMGAQRKMKLLHDRLIESHRAGFHHTLLVEEAHALPKEVLKQLKRYAELTDGLTPLLSILLIGQTELAGVLNENDAGVREVVQRCDLLELPDLGNDLEAFLAHKFKRVDVDVASVLDAGVADALRKKLPSKSTPKSGKGQRSFGQQATRPLLHPLAVANMVTAAMNAAVEIGAPKVTADLIEEV